MDSNIVFISQPPLHPLVHTTNTHTLNVSTTGTLSVGNDERLTRKVIYQNLRLVLPAAIKSLRDFIFTPDLFVVVASYTQWLKNDNLAQTAT